MLRFRVVKSVLIFILSASALGQDVNKSMFLGGATLLYSDDDSGYRYYKVPVLNGTLLEEGQVSETCAEAGLEAVCPGLETCQFTDTTKCLVTPLSRSCGDPL